MREAIFERFQQVKISDAVDKGGSGLGLAICKNIVELHGGTIKVENNQAGPGSTFTFSLPLSKNTPSA
jgi:signal transduction histidine kinase